MSSKGSVISIEAAGKARVFDNLKRRAIKNKNELNKTKEVVNTNSDDIHQNKINIGRVSNKLNNIGNILFEEMLNFSASEYQTIKSKKNKLEFTMIDTFPINLDYKDFAFKPLRSADFLIFGTINIQSLTHKEGTRGIEFTFHEIKENKTLFSIKHHWTHNEQIQIPISCVIHLNGSHTKHYHYQFEAKALGCDLTMKDASINLFKINGIME